MPEPNRMRSQALAPDAPRAQAGGGRAGRAPFDSHTSPSNPRGVILGSDWGLLEGEEGVLGVWWEVCWCGQGLARVGGGLGLKQD